MSFWTSLKNLNIKNGYSQTYSIYTFRYSCKTTYSFENPIHFFDEYCKQYLLYLNQCQIFTRISFLNMDILLNIQSFLLSEYLYFIFCQNIYIHWIYIPIIYYYYYCQKRNPKLNDIQNIHKYLL